MMKRNEKQHYTKAARAVCLVLTCLMAVYGGCGQEQEEIPVEDIELLDPVGVAVNYETAARRNLYNADVYSALVCPYVEEYGLDVSGYFSGYDSFPGDPVVKGSKLLHNDTENIDKQIENLEKSMADIEENYQEFLAENGEALSKARSDQQYYNTVMGNLERQKPDQFLTDSGTGEVTNNPAYQEWYNGAYGFRWCDNNLRNANQSVMELEEALKERTELYELDQAYNRLCLNRLKEDKKDATLVSGMAGNVASIRLLSEGYSWTGANQPLMSVCDTSRVTIRCDYVSASDVNRATEVYAIVNGKRYEVEYEEMDSQEYQTLRDQRQEVYSTFHIISGAEEIEIGAYAVIVVKKQVRENVVTVPRDAISRDGSTYYVYLVNGNENVYTVVTTGMTDGMYTEILSGVNEGDKVRTEQAVTAEEGTVTVVRGSMGAKFSGVGQLYYLSTETVKNPVEYGTCYFDTFMVNVYQRVQKGDVLAKIWVVPDEAEIGRNEQRLLRQRERLEDLKKEGIEGNEKIIEQMEESIRDLEELIADMKADAKVTEIKAPRDGVILSYGSYGDRWPDHGALLPSGTSMFSLADESSCYVSVEDPNGQLGYGNTVSMTYEDRWNGTKGEITGEVVSLNKMCISRNLSSEDALIRVAPEDISKIAGNWGEVFSGYWSRGYTQVTATIRNMDNVLLVPRSAVTENNGRTYVKVRLESGEIQYRSFIAGGYDASNYWVVEGLTEGMELCLR